jgi:signal transduction histidine kinase
MENIERSETTFRKVFLIAFTLILSTSIIYFVGFVFYSFYPGFGFDPSTGSEIEVFDPDQAGVFQPGDRITAVNGLDVETYRKNLSASFWEGVDVGDQVSINLVREEQPQTVTWMISGFTEAEFNERFLTHWPLALSFLTLSFCMVKFVDVGNPLRKILGSTFLILALWVIIADGPGDQHLWYSGYLVRIIGWMIIPLAVHIHWLFPAPFRRVPGWVNRMGIPLVYLVSATCMAADLFDPTLMLFETGMVITFSVGVFFLGQHYLHQKEHRSRVSLVFRFAMLAILPTLLLAIGKEFHLYLDNHAKFAAISGYSVFSAGYLFALWHRNPTVYYRRANRYLAVYIFMILIILLSLSIVDVIEYVHGEIYTLEIIGLIVVIGVISSLGFETFESFIAKYVIDVPQEVPNLLQSYAQILETTQDTASISSLLGGLILPALQIRQSVLIEIQSEQVIRVLDMNGVVETQIPNLGEIHTITDQKSKVLVPARLKSMIPQKRWIRVVLPLRFDDELIGVWLLGRRDPNDLYEDHIVEALETIAQHTTFAIINHQKTVRLRSLYEDNINRHEAERASLARELHDDTLNNLALLQREFGDSNLASSLHTITSSLRKIIQGLRPEMLSYGLVTALQDLADVLNERMESPRIEVDLEGDPIALNQNTELHIFRIVQQACENAQEHSDATTIKIEGKIEENSILLRVMDDGQGFDGEKPLDLTALIRDRHFGLAGMYERANIINAKLKVDTAPGKGTTISLDWKKSNKN